MFCPRLARSYVAQRHLVLFLHSLHRTTYLGMLLEMIVAPVPDEKSVVLPSFAEPRPAMRGRYFIRNRRAASIMAFIDASIDLLHIGRVPTVAPVQPRRILVANWAHLGDVILALPTLRVLRANFPKAEIGFLGGSWACAVLEATGLVDHLHVVDHFMLNRAPSSRLSKFRRYVEMRRQALTEIRSKDYDVAIDLSSHFPPVSPLLSAARVPVRAGFTSGGLGPFLTHRVTWVQKSRPMSDYPRDLLHALWPNMLLAEDALAPCYPGHPCVPLPDSLRGRSYLVIHMGTGAVHKEWPDQNWIEVATALAQSGLQLVAVGSGKREVERANRVAAALPSGVITLVMNRPWAEYVGIIARATHVICLDSSSAHVAAAFSVATTAVYPGIVDPGQWGPWNPKARMLTAPVGCSPCYRNVGCGAMTCIRGVTSEQVIRTVRNAITG
jgi:ADP-heptose:LPS heptosyltransferase